MTEDQDKGPIPTYRSFQQPTAPKPIKSRKRKIFIIVGLVLLLGIGFFLLKKRSQPTSSPATPVATTQSPEAQPDRIRLLATGDFVFHDSVNANAKQNDGSYNYLSMMKDFQPIFQSADIRFCNQVTLIGGQEFGISGYPKFNAPLEAVRDMNSLGCNLVNMASNHSFNKNQKVIGANVAEWEKQDNMLAAVGQNRSAAEKSKVHYFEVKGVKFAFLAYTTYINNDSPAQNNYGVSVYSRGLAKSQIAEAKKNGAEVVIVSMRWGDEYSSSVNSAQKSESNFLADQGVQLILGHGTHILQPVQKLKGGTIVWYGLGNFLNMQLEPEGLFNGVAVVDFNPKTHEVDKLGFLPFYMHYTWSAAQAKAEDLMARRDPHMALLEDASQAQVDNNQLKTTIDAQKQRLQKTLNTYMQVPLLTKDEL